MNVIPRFHTRGATGLRRRRESAQIQFWEVSVIRYVLTKIKVLNRNYEILQKKIRSNCKIFKQLYLLSYEIFFVEFFFQLTEISSKITPLNVLRHTTVLRISHGFTLWRTYSDSRVYTIKLCGRTVTYLVNPWLIPNTVVCLSTFKSVFFEESWFS